MPDFDWQNLAALATVLAAAVYLARRFVRRGKGLGSGACDTCSGCASTGERKLISLDGFRKRP